MRRWPDTEQSQFAFLDNHLFPPLLDQRSSTTLLVSPGTEGLDLIGLEEPEDEILEEPEQHLSMHPRQRASRHRGGEKPVQQAEVRLIDTA